MAVAPLVRVFEEGDYTEHVERAVEALRGGGLVVLPTETVYGVAGRLDDRGALARLRELPPSTSAPLIVHVAEQSDAHKYLGPVGDLGRRMMRKLWPGPVGLVFDVPADRQREVAGKLGVEVSDLYNGSTVTLRCPSDMVATDILSIVESPVVLRRLPGEGRDAEETEWSDKVDLVLDSGPPMYAKPSTLVKVMDDGFEIIRAGVYDRRIVEKMLRTTVLFVCSGNTCRSPMAEALARQVLAQKLGVSEEELESRGYSVMSAGTFAMPGARATPAAVEAVRKLGAELANHRSRPLTVEAINLADVIFTMGSGHAAMVRTILPSADAKLMPLDPEGNVEDPIGSDVETYQRLAGRLREMIEKRLEDAGIP